MTWKSEQAKTLAIRAKNGRDAFLRRKGVLPKRPEYLAGPVKARIMGRPSGQLTGGFRHASEMGKVHGGQVVCNITGKRLFKAAS